MKCKDCTMELLESRIKEGQRLTELTHLIYPWVDIECEISKLLHDLAQHDSTNAEEVERIAALLSSKATEFVVATDNLKLCLSVLAYFIDKEKNK